MGFDKKKQMIDIDLVFGFANHLKKVHMILSKLKIISIFKSITKTKGSSGEEERKRNESHSGVHYISFYKYHMFPH
jgi:hypothetical protein